MTTATSTYSPTITIVSITGGLFRVQSESDWMTDYEVSVPGKSCTCKAGQAGRNCKHYRLVEPIYRVAVKSLQMVNHQPRPWVVQQPAAVQAAMQTQGTAAA